MKKKDINKIKLIQKKWKNLLLFKNDLETELDFFRVLVNTMLENIENNNRDSIDTYVEDTSYDYGDGDGNNDNDEI